MPTVKGFKFSGVSSGLKSGRNNKDVALIVSEVPAHAAAVVTTSRVKAAPIQICLKRQKSGKGQAVIVNSGNANACTGPQGLKDAQTMCRETAKALGIAESLVWVASTGKIGEMLPLAKIQQGIQESVQKLSATGYQEAAQAILTTDQFTKYAHRKGTIGSKAYSLLGIAKGAGMIMPQMSPTGHATMLAFILTDAAINPTTLKGMLTRCVDPTFNAITVDGDTSTNDMVLILANGQAGNPPLKANVKGAQQFEKHLFEVCHELAQMMVRDGEGATKVVQIDVKGARNPQAAEKIARTVGNSLLVKTAFFGEDPNWGRLLGAAGRAGVALDPDKVDLYYDKVCLVKKGACVSPQAEEQAKKVAQQASFIVTLDLHMGKGSYTLYSSDLGHNYVQLNSEYRT
jgi:glutamate N-acetyltransferase / amino-acid N-acetyltransferase